MQTADPEMQTGAGAIYACLSVCCNVFPWQPDAIKRFSLNILHVLFLFYNFSLLVINFCEKQCHDDLFIYTYECSFVFIFLSLETSILTTYINRENRKVNDESLWQTKM